jgi:hypothetical protein
MRASKATVYLAEQLKYMYNTMSGPFSPCFFIHFSEFLVEEGEVEWRGHRKY